MKMTSVQRKTNLVMQIVLALPFVFCRSDYDGTESVGCELSTSELFGFVSIVHPTQHPRVGRW